MAKPEPDPFLRIFRDYLIAEELARDPTEAAPEAYPLWLEPRDGAIAPNEREDPVENDEDLVMSAYRRPGLATGPYEGGTFRFDNVELRMRTERPTLAYSLERALLGDPDADPVLHDRRDWIMGGAGAAPADQIRVIESMLYLPLANLGSGDQGFTFRMEVAFQRYVPEL